MRGWGGPPDRVRAVGIEGSVVIRISLERASQRDRLAKPVFGVDGKMLLNSGVELNEAYLARLVEHGVREIYVAAPGPELAAAEDAVSDASRIELLACAHACMSAAHENFSLPTPRALEAIAGVSDDMRRRRGISVAVSPARSSVDWWEIHARNVALLCVGTAQAMELSQAEISHIGVGALLHDIGLVGLSLEPLSSPEQRTRGAGRGHPVLGFQELMLDPQISASSAVVCLQHHERRDGSGFPKHLTADEISLPAQMCAVADTYDALIAPPPFGEGIMPHLALQQVRAQANLAAPSIMDAFQQAVAPYPLASLLRLSNGSIVVVAEPRAAGAASLRVRTVEGNGSSPAMDINLIGERGMAVEVL